MISRRCKGVLVGQALGIKREGTVAKIVKGQTLSAARAGPTGLVASSAHALQDRGQPDPSTSNLLLLIPS
jgi:hypothetical protein